MLYAILCYHHEADVKAWTTQEDEAVLAKRAKVTDKLAEQGKLGPAVRLDFTTEAATVRSGSAPLVLDGPFAETKEQLLGFYVVDCASIEDAIQVARDLGQDESGAFEIRPIRLYKPGTDGIPLHV